MEPVYCTNGGQYNRGNKQVQEWREQAPTFLTESVSLAMNLDDAFENVWDTPDPVPASVPDSPETTPTFQPASDDFDDADFAEPMSQNDAFANDDFGDDDFGDFGDEQPLESAGISHNQSFINPEPPSQPWDPLRLDPLPSRSELTEHTHDIVAPIFSYDLSQITSDIPIREAEGVAQVLVAPERCVTLQLFPSHFIWIHIPHTVVTCITCSSALHHQQNLQIGSVPKSDGNSLLLWEFQSIWTKFSPH